MRAKLEEFCIVCLHNDAGFDASDFFPIRDAVIAADPDFWEYLNPGTLIAFFRLRKDGRAKGERLASTIKKMTNTDDFFSSLCWSTLEGKLVADFSWTGKLKSSPFGLTVNAAMELARKKSRSKSTG